MAGRKKKNTVDYFPHYIGEGKKIQYIEAKYGNDGYAAWFKILESLATTPDHYIDLNDEIEKVFLANKCKVKIEILEAILDDLAMLGSINKIFWKRRVIWSEIFIESIKDTYKKRSSIALDFQSLQNHLFQTENEKNPISASEIAISDTEIPISGGNCREIRKEENKKRGKEEIRKVFCPENEKFSEPQPAKKSIEERKIEFKKSIDPYVQKYSSEMLNSFFSYWTEKNEKGIKMRFEMQKVFEVGKRLATWQKNENKNFKSNNNGKHAETRQSRIDDVADFRKLTKQIIANGSQNNQTSSSK